MNPFSPRLIAISLIALGAVGCTNTGSVMGSVTLERDSRPIKDARVVLIPAGGSKGQTSVADWGGNYKINVKEGEYTIAAEHPGLVICDPGPLPVQVVGNQVARVDLCLQEESTTAPSLAPPAGATDGAPAQAPTAPTVENNTAPAQAEPNDQVVVTPLPDNNDAGSGTTAGQYPPSAPPTYPPAPTVSGSTN